MADLIRLSQLFFLIKTNQKMQRIIYLLTFITIIANSTSLFANCNDAEYISCGETYYRSTINASNDFDIADYEDCIPSTSSSFNAGDYIFSFYRSFYDETNYITLDYFGGADLDIIVLSECSGSSIICTPDLYSTDGVGTYPANRNVEVLEIKDWPAGEYFIVIDGYQAGQEADFALSLSCEGLYCEGADPIWCDDPIFGSIEPWESNQSSAYSLNCFEPDIAQGMFTSGEDLYNFNPPHTGSYTITLDIADASQDLELFLIDECCPVVIDPNDPTVFVVTDPICNAPCFEGSTSSQGQSESITIDLVAGDDLTIVVDGFLLSTSNYTLTVHCNTFECTDATPIECGESIDWSNFGGNNNADSYCNQYINLTGNEAIFSIIPDQSQVYDFYLTNVSVGVDLDMFLLPSCDPLQCLASSDGTTSNLPDHISIYLQQGVEYHLIVDGDNNGFINAQVNSAFSLNVNCEMVCDKRPLSCPDNDNWNNANSQNSNVCVYQCTANGTTTTSSNMSGKEVSYEFIPTSSGSYTFSLSGVDSGDDLDIFVLTECDPTSCIASTDFSSSSAADIVEVQLIAGNTYCIIVDSEDQDISPYQLSVSGCNNYCDDVYTENSDGGYVLFNTENIPGQVQYMEVSYPLENQSTGNFDFVDQVDLSEEQAAEFYCPTAGCYYICVWYLDNGGNVQECCFKYCAEFPNYECDYVPTLSINNDNNINGSFCGWSCGSGGVLTQSTESYIQVTGSNVDVQLDENEEVFLPYGSYEVCCYVYDPICDTYDICCDIFCLPYVYPEEECDDNIYFQNTDDYNVYFWEGQGDDIGLVIDITPSTGWILDEENLPPQNPSMPDQTLTFTEDGIYRVCVYDPMGDVCCQNICVEPEAEEGSCIDITPLPNNNIFITCATDSAVRQWSVSDPSCPDGICQYYTSAPSFEYEITETGEYTICKSYYGCCGDLEFCCETYCYSPFEPYLETSEVPEFDHCDGITVNSINQASETIAHGTFEYVGAGAGMQGSRWEIWTDGNTAETYDQLYVGDNATTFSTSGSTILFEPGKLYYVCYTYLDADGCKIYCCIKVNIPSQCNSNHGINYLGGLTYSYTADISNNEQIVAWTARGELTTANLDIDGNTVEYTFPFEGTYYLCCVIWDNVNKCYTVCCTKYCITNALSCGNSGGITATYNTATMTYNLTLLESNIGNATWQIDLPSSLAGTIIDTPSNFKPSDYGINPGTEITVSARYQSTDGCHRMCCKTITPPIPADAVEFRIGDMCGAPNSIISVPVTVQNFEQMTSFGFSVSSTNSNHVKIVGMSAGPQFPALLSYALISESAASVNWFPISGSATTVENNTVIAHIEVELGSSINSSAILRIDNSIIPITAEQNQSPITPITYAGTICIEQSNSSICGSISREDNLPINNVNVTLNSSNGAQSVTTSEDGSYCFENLDSGVYTITPHKDNNHKNGVTPGDLFFLRTHTLNIQPLATPYRLIAADINNSESVTPGDIFSLNRMTLNLDNEFTNNTSWRFVDASYNFPDAQNPFAPSYPESKQVTLSTSDINVDFVGCKIGDVNLSNDPQNIHQELEATVRDGITLTINSTNLPEGESTRIPVTISGFDELISNSFSLAWSPDELENIEIESTQVGYELNESNFNLEHINEGSLGVVWFSTTGFPVSIDDDEILFYIKVTPKVIAGSNPSIFITDSPVDITAETLEGNISTSFDTQEHTVVMPTDINDVYESITNIKVYPNPFSNKISIELQSDESTDATISIVTVNGELVWNKELKLLEGKQNINLDTDNLQMPSGVYIIKMSTPSSTKSIKLIKS